MEMDINEKGIEDVIKSLADVFGPSKESVAAMCNIIDELAPTNPADLEQFARVSLEFEYTLDKASRHYIKNPDNADLRFLFTDYWFLKSHIEKLLSKKEEYGCEADKSRFILDKYQKYLEEGVYPDIQWDQDKYYIPRFGDSETWFTYLKSLRLLKLGYITEYLAALDALLQYEPRRYERTYERVTVTFNNGQSVKLPPFTSLPSIGDFVYVSCILCKRAGVELTYKVVAHGPGEKFPIPMPHYEIPANEVTVITETYTTTV